MPNQTNKPTKPQRYILLDTNIFKYLGNTELYPQIIYLLKDAISKGYGLAISKFTQFELLDTATVEDELKAFASIKGLKHFQIIERTLITAGHLGCLYKDDQFEGAKAGDKIIGASAIEHNAVIFTVNGRDFPSPFFSALAKPLLKYTKNGVDAHMVFYFLEPDHNILQTKYQPRVDEANKKIQDVQQKQIAAAAKPVIENQGT